jgi:orotidine-5'-phosphate decarboxylase
MNSLPNLFPDPKIIIALDFADINQVLRIVDQLHPHHCRLKIGNELFTQAGTAIVKLLIDRGFSIFLDLKFHDIPNTVAKACSAAADLGLWMLDLHTLGGPKMMEAAAETLQKRQGPKPLLIGVTLLTSHEPKDMPELGLSENIPEHVRRLSLLAKNCGLDGVVCSPIEADAVREQCGEHFCLVTPGIRPLMAAANDQSRIMTPTAAIAAGANYLVIGRPITQAPDPWQALQTIERQLTEGR